MKNIHVLPTDKPSRLRIGSNFNFVLGLVQSYIVSKNDSYTNRHIYITSDEDIKEGDWVIYNNKVFKIGRGDNELFHLSKKIILTTDQDLIKDGVQDIDNEFLEWFVKNPSCEKVKVDKNWNYPLDKSWEYKLRIIPQEEQKQHLIDMMRGDEELGIYEEPKQETLEEVQLAILFHNTYENLAPNFGYETRADTKSFETTTPNGMLMIAVCKEIIKWQQERSYSEEEKDLLTKMFNLYWYENNNEHEDNLEEWELSKRLFNQLK
jgi:hypothetical protein